MTQGGRIREWLIVYCLSQQNYSHQMKPSGPKVRAEGCAPHLAVQPLAVRRCVGQEFPWIQKTRKFRKNTSKAAEYKMNTTVSESPWPADPQRLESILGRSITWLVWSWESSQGICCCWCFSQDTGMDLVRASMLLTVQHCRNELCFLLRLLVRYWTYYSQNVD